MTDFPDCPAHEVKIRILFNELDVKRRQGISIEEMIVVFKRMHVAFSSATINDLFEKGDANGDGIITMDEWRRFGECYPTLMDCLYYRAKDYWLDIAQKEAIEDSQRLLEELKEKEARCREAHARSIAEVEEAERKLAQQVQILLEAQRREAEAKAQMDAAHQVTEKARADLRDRIAELNSAKDLERQRQMELSERQRSLEAAIRRLQCQEAEVTKAQERLRDIDRMLQEQQREVEKQIAGAERCRAEVEAEEIKEQEAHRIAAEALKQVHACAETVAAAEDRLAETVDQEKQAALVLRDAAEDTQRQIARRDAEQKAVSLAKENEAACAEGVAKAGEAVTDQEHRVQQQIQENIDFVEKRRQVDDEEGPLVEQEVRLREQRENLERKESRLRSDFTAFAERSTHQRIDSPRGPVSPRTLTAAPALPAAPSTPRVQAHVASGSGAGEPADVQISSPRVPYHYQYTENQKQLMTSPAGTGAGDSVRASRRYSEHSQVRSSSIAMTPTGGATVRYA
eukprot:TRINITY_DN7128_c0_g1_i1.p1 TRINITY_DN7128_c0_g1~~TRINITY_DN7128_c0_g1_i1.p1  ORF type:complete len:514 (+),score=143.05 TRINITY_DN7128_c0_g1_i1:68-1609(+)